MLVKNLNVAPGLELPIDYVTMTAAILAQRRKGKTYTGSVFAEELYEARLPWVALDPTGAWWGLRSSADGLSAGLPCVVIGGQHGDLPLEAGGGAIVADLVLDHPGWYVIDLSLLEGRPAEREFATDFGARLHRRKMQPGMDFPLHLFVDEADLFVPQEKEAKADVALLAAYQGIVRRGGLHGLGTTLISQRPALVNKNVLTQLDMLVLLRLVAGNDQDAVYKNYVSRFASKEKAAEIMDSLATLPVGDAWFLEPGAEPPVIVRSRARERRTFNSSATPKPGERRVEPTVLAEVDLEELRGQMAATIEKAKADDPAELRRRIRELEQRPASAERVEVERIVEVEVEKPVEVPVLSPDQIDALRDIAGIADAARQKLEEMVAQVVGTVNTAMAAATAARVSRERPARRPAPRGPRIELGKTIAEAVAREFESSNGKLPGPQQKILDALAWWRTVGKEQPTRGQVAFVVGNHQRSKGFTNSLSALSSAGLIEYAAPGRVALTAEGDALAHAPAHTPGDEELQEMIFKQIGPARTRILKYVIDADAEITREELAEAMGYHPRSKGFTNSVSSLSGLDLLEYPRPGYVRASSLCFVGEPAYA